MEELKNIKCPEKWFLTESKFTTWWLWELKKKWFWKKKWSDMSQERKPYDCNIATPFGDYYVEVKIIRKWDNFSFDQFEPNQIKALEDLTKLWRNAIVVIYSIKENSYKVILYKDLKKNFTNRKKWI